MRGRLWLLVAVCLSLLLPAARAQTRVINGGRVQVGANDISGIFQVTVPISDAQTKALSTTGITVVPAPGAGLAIEPILAILYAQTAAGAYTNIDAGAFLGIQMGGVYRMGFVPNDASIATGSPTRASDLLGSTTPRSVRFLPYFDTESVHANGFVPSVEQTSTFVNAALQLTLANAGSGDLTGGNAANVLQVFVVYRVISTTSPLTVTCPANLSTTSSDGSAVAVTYAAPTISGGVSPTGAYDLASGSSFDPGATSSTTRVTYTASSTDGQAAACSFTVTVTNISGSGLTFGAYYVARSGSDTVSCAQAKNAATPKQTIVAGLACLAAGDTLYVRAGTYDEHLLNSQSQRQVAGGTSWANKVRIAAYPGETVWMRPTSGSISAVIWFVTETSQYIELDGINLDASAMTDIAGLVTGGTDPATQMAHHIRIQHAEIIRATTSGGCLSGGCPETDAILFGAHEVEGTIGSNEALNLNIHGGASAFGYGIYLSGPNNLVDGCNIHDTSSAGVQIYNGGGDSADHNIVRNTRIHDIATSGQGRGWGILIGGDHNQIYNNVIDGVTLSFTSTSAGIYVYSGASNLVANNTVTANAMPGIVINGGQVGNVIQNNIAYLNTGGDYIDGGSGTTHDHNLEGTDPVFVNAGAFDFHLQTISPAKTSGVTVAGVTTDHDGFTYASPPSIGAYQFH